MALAHVIRVALIIGLCLIHFIPEPLEGIWRGIPWPFVADNVAY
jgi:hypothetical protein